MKYKATSDFNSPRFGSVKSGDMVELTEELAKQMQAVGIIEIKPEVAKIETKPAKQAKKTK